MPFGQRMPQAMPYHPFVRLRVFLGLVLWWLCLRVCICVLLCLIQSPPVPARKQLASKKGQPAVQSGTKKHRRFHPERRGARPRVFFDPRFLFNCGAMRKASVSKARRIVVGIGIVTGGSRNRNHSRIQFFPIVVVVPRFRFLSFLSSYFFIQTKVLIQNFHVKLLNLQFIDPPRI